MYKKQNSKIAPESNASIKTDIKSPLVAGVLNKFINFNKLVFFNIVLLGLVVSLLAVMYLDVNKIANKPSALAQTQNKPLMVTEQNHPTIVIARNSEPKMKISLPIKKSATRRKTCGDIIVDGRRGNTKLPRMLTINGNLYLQNLQTYVLPCDTNIRGNLLLHNVKLLKFCGRFNVNGDILVSNNSSFGPLPKDARLGGTIVF